MAITLIPTQHARHLAAKLAELDGFSTVWPRPHKNDSVVFPDGEIYHNLSLEEIPPNDHIMIIASGAPAPNDCLFEMELIGAQCSAAKRPVAGICFTYFPYGMQDSVFTAGELNVAEHLVSKLTAMPGLQKIYTVDAHFSGRGWVEKYPLVNIPTHETLMLAAQAAYPDVVFVSADQGAVRRTNVPGFTKQRRDIYTVDIITDPTFHDTVRGKTVAILDDLIETGGTLARIADTIAATGAQKRIVVATHGVLESGLKRVRNAYDDLFLSNSIESPYGNVDLSHLIARTLIEHAKSVAA